MLLAWPGVMLLVVATPATPAARSLGHIAVLEIRVGGGVDPAIAGPLTARLAEVIGKRGHSVIAPDDIRAMLEQEMQRQLVGCTDEGCLAEIAGALGADALVAGRLSKLEHGFAFSLSLVDARAARALAHTSQTWGGESIALLELIAPMIDLLLAEKGASLTGSIEIEGAVSGSRILIDDQIRGTAPAGQLGRVPVGARRVQIVADGHEPVERWVVVKTDQLTSIAIEQRALEGRAFYATWWFWSLAAAGVAGAAVATAMVASGGSPGQTGVNAQINADDAFTRR
ncbi:MAG: PEGA domain-containing protein [Deltaproteobacteria bacterium]|nr:PEGA domain-containing protein [Deltaproteobacteria bacterium]